MATVSRVLNHPESVLPETRTHVLNIMKENNYKPNYFARALNLGKTNTLMLLIPDIENPLYGKLLSGVEEVAVKKNHSVLICSFHNDKKIENEYLNMAKERNIDGMILVTSNMSQDELSNMSKDGLKYVLAGSSNSNFKSQCYINYEDGAKKLISHLLDLGHKNINFYLDKNAPNDNIHILKGYNKTISQYKYMPPATVNYISDNFKSAYIEAVKMIETGTLPDVVFTSSDEMAFGFIKAAQNNSLSIPEDFALCAFRDSSAASLIKPELTTVDQPARKLGLVAARMLFDIMEEQNEDEDFTQEIVLQPKLIIRKSCGNNKNIYELFE